MPELDGSQPPPPDEPYVFISYARPDEAVARQVEDFLLAAKCRVFRDQSQIGVGDFWNTKIETALQECHCMVVLLSEAALTNRIQVEREWQPYVNEGKKVYPLLLQDCTLPSWFKQIQYEDARADLQGALTRLLQKLQRDFGLSDGVVSQPADPLIVYHRERIAEWSLPRYELDRRFVNLTLTLDRPDDPQQRWQPVNEPPLRDLREVLEKAQAHPALVLLGAPGSGKSTLLRRLQLDHSQDRLNDGGAQLSFFVALNEHRGEQPPRAWLAQVWAERYPALPPLDALLKDGRMLLLLDALNEMKPRVGDYASQIAEWKAFVQQAARAGNRLLFSCRSRDIGAAQLGSKELPVPLVEVQPLTATQMPEFLAAYAPAHQTRIWQELNGSRQFELFQTPYFLKLLCDEVTATGAFPTGRAGLFTGFVRRVLDREKDGTLFQPGALLSARDHQKLASGRDWRDEFDLPQHGKLIPKLSQLAYDMQKRGAEVNVDYDEACQLLADEHAENLLKAGVELSLLDEARDTIKFFHQLLQEYFAARRLAKAPDAALVHVEWEAARVTPSLDETLDTLAVGEPLPPLAQTGWEETTLTAAPLAAQPEPFIRALIPHNLPLAARCAAASEVRVSPELKDELRALLVKRAQDFDRADLRARIAAGEALGLLGDPRFARRNGPHGAYLLPPLCAIAGGVYPMGLDNAPNEREGPAHQVTLAPFNIGQFPVTNAEYALFLAAGGYEEKRWWDTPQALAWLEEGGSEGAKESWRETRQLLQRNWSDEEIRGQANWTPELQDQYIDIRNETAEEFEQRLEEWYPSGKLYREPEFWNDTRFNNPAQPVVGVTWFEARAYCNWLTANVADGRLYRLPTEAEFEAAARGKQGRLFPYGKNFDQKKSNTFESHIRRTTPVGLFDNATSAGAFDLSGNAYTWTLSIYDQQQFPYPYRPADGRENVLATDVKRVLRGGSWFNLRSYARAVYRLIYDPGVRDIYFGFRVAVVRPPSAPL